jgi:hypothetical protein
VNIDYQREEGAIMRRVTLLAMGVSVTLASAAMAVTPDTSAKGIKPATLTCEEFLAVDDITRPQFVYWAEGVNSKGKPEDAVLDVERTNRLIPVLIEDCKKAPQTSFLTKVKADLRKIF